MYLDSMIVHRPSQTVLKNVKNSSRTKALKVKCSSSSGRSVSCSSILSVANFSYSDARKIDNLSYFILLYKQKKYEYLKSKIIGVTEPLSKV